MHVDVTGISGKSVFIGPSGFEGRLFNTVTRILAIFGIRELCLAATSINGTQHYDVGDVKYFDDVPQMVKNIADTLRRSFVDLLSVLGVGCVRFTLSDSEKSDYGSLWGGGPGVPYVLDSEVPPAPLLNEDVVDQPQYVEQLEEYIHGDSADSDLVENDTDSIKISAVYEAITSMLPVEGRDYVLNPEIRESGAVGFSPVAYSDIGRLWLEYLSENLQKRLSVKVDSKKLKDTLKDEKSEKENSIGDKNDAPINS